MALSGQERREQILKILRNSGQPVAGTDLARKLEVSRQIIVQDMALIRANGVDVISTHRGYVIQNSNQASRVFKVIHTDEQVEEEENARDIIDVLDKISDNKFGLYSYDRELAARVYTTPSPLATTE